MTHRSRESGDVRSRVTRPCADVALRALSIRALSIRAQSIRALSIRAQSMRALSIVALALALAPAGACTRSDAGPLRVMTYNIAAGHGDLDGIARVIRAADPEIVALQEVDVRWSERSGFADQATELGAALGMHVRFGAIYTLPSASGGDGRSRASGVTRSAASGETLSPVDADSAPPRQFGLAILSRQAIVAFTNHPIPRLSTQTDATEPEPMPGFLEAVIDVRGVRLHVFNTHLDYRADPRVREQQVARMLEVMRERAAPQILMGDLNARPDAAELQPLLTRFTDAWSVATGDGATYPAQTPDRRIDYILLSDDVRVAAADVLPALASDHRAVVADILILRPGVRN